MQEHILHHCEQSCKYFPSEQNLAYEEQLKVCGKELPHLDYDQVCAHWQQFQSCLYLIKKCLGDGAKLPGSVPQGDTTTATTHYDNDEDGENTTSI